MDKQHLPMPLLSDILNSMHTHAVSAPHFILIKWAELSLKLWCSLGANQRMYIMRVTLYIPGVNGVKNSLVGACELFSNQQILTKGMPAI